MKEEPYQLHTTAAEAESDNSFGAYRLNCRTFWTNAVLEPTQSVSGAAFRFSLGEAAINAADQAIAEALLHTLGKSSCLGVPILLEGRIWGELFATRSEDQPAFTDDDLEYASAVSAQVAAGIAQGQHLEQVARLAYTDALTGLANRRAIDDRLDRAMDLHRSDGVVVSMIVVDVNGRCRTIF